MLDSPNSVLEILKLIPTASLKPTQGLFSRIGFDVVGTQACLQRCCLLAVLVNFRAADLQRSAETGMPQIRTCFLVQVKARAANSAPAAVCAAATAVVAAGLEEALNEVQLPFPRRCGSSSPEASRRAVLSPSRPSPSPGPSPGAGPRAEDCKHRPAASGAATLPNRLQRPEKLRRPNETSLLALASGDATSDVRVVTYNVLSPTLCSARRFPHCNEQELALPDALLAWSSKLQSEHLRGSCKDGF